MENRAHILILDDDTKIRELLSQYLRDQEFFISTAKDTSKARELLSYFQFDLLIVDVMMPNESGIEFTTWLRKESQVPVLMLTAMGETEDRIAGLESGADDYLPKPFEPRELVLRIKRILRHLAVKPPKEEETKLLMGPFEYYYKSQQLLRNDKVQYLTEAEARLLSVLATHVGELMSREQLAAFCSEDGKIVNERSIDVQMTRLRQKIESNPKQPRFLRTIRGRGYQLIGD